MNAADMLPDDHRSAVLLGRVLTQDGPTPVLLRDGQLEDMSCIAPTVSDLLERFGPEEPLPRGSVGDIENLVLAPHWDDGGLPRLLAPIDLQCIKASGVTFAVSAIERMIEERARGDSSAADAIRASIRDRIGGELRSVVPGSAQAATLKDGLIADGLWSQSLEVAIGPDAEIFTKAPVLSAVGSGADVGVRADSRWNNPEPEIAILCDSKGNARGATLANDVNLRDIEGRSALLLGEAKDNNASCAIGPFVRLFDGRFTLDDIRTAEVTLRVVGEDGFRMEGSSNMTMISRDPLALIGQACGRHHQYPDGFILLLGTMFAPTEDRETEGGGFTHKRGDIVEVATPHLGKLINRVVTCEEAPAWSMGIAGLFRNLAQRGLVQA
jgi:fumarylacetoacetate (FAA) hydrolase family protein